MLDGRPTCGAKNANGTICDRPAFPNGRCKQHGGAKFRTGRYGNHLRGVLAETFDRMLAEDPCDLTEELALARTICANTVKILALLSEKEEQDPGSCTAEMLDACRLIRENIAQISSLSDTVSRIQLRKSITPGQVGLVLENIIRALQRNLGKTLDASVVREVAESLRSMPWPDRSDSEALRKPLLASVIGSEPQTLTGVDPEGDWDPE